MKVSTFCVLQFWIACCLFSLFPFPSVSAQVTDHRSASAVPVNEPSVHGYGTIQEAGFCPALLTKPLHTYQQFYPIILVHTPNTPFVLLVNFYRTGTTPNRISRFIDLLDRRQSRWAVRSLPEIRKPIRAPYISADVNRILFTC